VVLELSRDALEVARRLLGVDLPRVELVGDGGDQLVLLRQAQRVGLRGVETDDAAPPTSGPRRPPSACAPASSTTSS
jgi:hypothetical protein